MSSVELVTSRPSLDPRLQEGLNPSCVLAHHDDLVAVLGPAVYTPDSRSVKIGWQVVLQGEFDTYEVQLYDWKSRVEGGPREHEYFWMLGSDDGAEGMAALCRYIWNKSPNTPRLSVYAGEATSKCPECGLDVEPGSLVVEKQGEKVHLKCFKFYYKNLFPFDVRLADVEYPDRTSHLRMAQHIFPYHPDVQEIFDNLRQGKWIREFP